MAKALPKTVRAFRSSALTVNVKKWEASEQGPESYFLELSKKITVNGEDRWANIQIESSDAAGVVDQVQRASTFAIAQEDQAQG